MKASCTIAFAVPIRVESGNRRQRSHWRRLHGRDSTVKGAVRAVMNVSVPRPLLAFFPHPRRTVRITVFRKRLLDRDNLYAGLKPVIDALKTVRMTNAKIKGSLYIRVDAGVIWDDSEEYLLLDASQRKIAKGEDEGVRIEVEF